MPLHPRHRLFIEAYLDRLNAAAAARAAGYSRNRDRQTGWDLLQRPEIKRAVERGFERRLMAADERARNEANRRHGRPAGFGKNGSRQ